jgi:hypothetical protein
MKETGQLHVSAFLLLFKMVLVSTGQEVGWAFRASLDVLEKNSLPLAGNSTPVV